jgi:hypothetical protein
MVWGFAYDVDAKGDWVSGSERGAFFHSDCWNVVKEALPSDKQNPEPPDQSS